MQSTLVAVALLAAIAFAPLALGESWTAPSTEFPTSQCLRCIVENLIPNQCYRTPDVEFCLP